MIKFRFYFFSCLLLLLTIGLTSACTTTPPVLKIALVAPFEGADRAIGYDAIYAARLAVREINEAGGVGGYRLALVALDDGGQADLAAGVAQSLVLDEQVIAVIGHGRAETTAAAQPIYEAAQLPLLPLGQDNFAPLDPAGLPAEFHTAYEAVTPFDEVAGPYAGPTYQAFQTILSALENAAENTPSLNRNQLAQSLHNSQ